LTVASAPIRFPRSSARRKAVHGWPCEVDVPPPWGRDGRESLGRVPPTFVHDASSGPRQAATFVHDASNGPRQGGVRVLFPCRRSQRRREVPTYKPHSSARRFSPSARRARFLHGQGDVVQPLERPPANPRRRDRGGEQQAEAGEQAAGRGGSRTILAGERSPRCSTRPAPRMRT
jgi:hypothetical protein